MESQAVSISSRFSLRSPFQWSRWLNGQTIAVGFLTLLLIWLIMVPLTVVIWGAFRDGQPGQAGAYTLSKFVEAYQDTLLQTVGNTLVFAFGASLLCLSIGTFLAWVTERTDAPLRPLICSGRLAARHRRPSVQRLQYGRHDLGSGHRPGVPALSADGGGLSFHGPFA
ncbi:MAG: hypothetical protein HYS66_12730 [Deltaproteobacteria bacterium]|nr:hypothetical protein [Deltaproteobacteria bacterium]